MPSILFTSSGSFKDTNALLQRMSKANIKNALDKYGAIGVAALKSATPVDTSASAHAWTYKVAQAKGMWRLSWHNQNRTSTGVPVVILIQYGHGTGTGGYVAGEDFINPAIKPIFDKIVTEVRREVVRR